MILTLNTLTFFERKLKSIPIFYRRCIVLSFYISFWTISVLTSAFLRYEHDRSSIREHEVSIFVYFLFILCIRIFLFQKMSLFRGVWAHTSIYDLQRIVGSTFFSSLLGWFTAYKFVHQYESKTIFLIECFVSTCLVGGFRLFFRLFKEGYFYAHRSDVFKKTLIVGAGNYAETIARFIQKDRISDCNIIGFVSIDYQDDLYFIHGIPVLGSFENIDFIIQEKSIEQIIVASEYVSGDRMRHLLELSKNMHIALRVFPSVKEILNGKISIDKTRNVSIEDVLNRRVIQCNLKDVEKNIYNEVVCVTGAGGSIGSELCRQISEMNPKCLMMMEKSENALFYILEEMKSKYPNMVIVSILIDITCYEKLEYYFNKYQPKYVFHAAAYKHVPMMEKFPHDAIENNVYGTKNMVDISIKNNVKRFVLISTDKAVNPSSVMGASKRIAEKYVENVFYEKSQEPCIFTIVRFGNVLGSAGSVIPIFKNQIENGGPVTVTHPDMKRYFMTIPEACSLVLKASNMGKSGDIFMLDMGEPVSILDMAKDLIRLSGYELNRDIKIVFTGIRPGEKLCEELGFDPKKSDKTEQNEIFLMKYEKDILVCRMIDEFLSHFKDMTELELRNQIQLIVPEYRFEQFFDLLNHQEDVA